MPVNDQQNDPRAQLQNREAEEAVVGAVLMAPDVLQDRKVFGLESNYFFTTRLGSIWNVAKKLHAQGKAVDQLTIAAALGDKKLKRIGGHAYLTKLVNSTPSSFNVGTYADIIGGYAARRAVYDMSAKLGGSVFADRSPESMLTDAEAQLAGLREGFFASEDPALGVISADDLLDMEFPEPVWAVPDILPIGLSILAGKSKVGKSWMALQIALAVGSGGMVFDRKVEKGKVLYLALEDSPRRLKARMRKLNWPRGVSVDFIPMGEFQDSIGYLENGGGQRLARRIKAESYRVVWIDTLSRAISAKQNEVEAMTAALAPLHEIAHETESLVAFNDHHRKVSAENPDAVLDILGSTGKSAVPDTVLGLYKQRGVRGGKLQLVGRDVEEKTLQLFFDKQTGCWQLEGEEEGDGLQMTEARRELLDAVRELGPSTCSMVAKATGKDRGNTYRQLQDLTNAGYLKQGGDTYSVPSNKQ